MSAVLLLLFISPIHLLQQIFIIGTHWSITSHFMIAFVTLLISSVNYTLLISSEYNIVISNRGKLDDICRQISSSDISWHDVQSKAKLIQ